MDDTIVENRECSYCGTSFGIEESNLRFYEKVDVPSPSTCPDCRQQLRLLQINEINLFKRRCDATGKNIISNFPPDSPYKVFSQEHWATDAFDGINYGRDYDFSKPFFEQFAELSKEVPRPALTTDYLHNENSDFVNYAARVKNCYLIFDSDEDQDCYYCYGTNGSRSSVDCYRVQALELCYHTIDSTKCYNCAFVTNSENCSDSILLNNCIGCSHCIMCSNLHHKQYYVLNQEVSEAAFQELRKQFESYEFLQKKIEEFDDFKLQFPQRYMRGFHNENVSGNHLVHSKNAHHCYDSMNIRDGKYCFQVFINIKDCMDIHEGGVGELMYHSTEVGFNAYNIRFCMNCIEQISNLTYCDHCYYGSSDLFGCIGLKRKKYCILNRQYSEQEYKGLLPRIIDQMTETGEWGRFFPPSISLFPYNLTLAQEFFPLTKKQALELGCSWRDPDQRDYLPQKITLPDKSKDAGSDLLKELLACENCGKNYKIIQQELEFYQKQGLPLPRKCFNCRHTTRILQRNPHHLWERTCQQCSCSILSSYAPMRPEIVYCEKCYQDAFD